MVYYNRTNTCDTCGNKLIKRSTKREYNKKGEWTGKWLCQSCYDKTKRVPKVRGFYNRNNICDICGNKLTKENARREYNKKGE